MPATPLVPTALLLAWLLLAGAVARANGGYERGAVVALLAATAAIAVAAVALAVGRSGRRRLHPPADGVPEGDDVSTDGRSVALGACIGGAALAAIAMDAGFYGSGWALVAARGLMAAAAVAAAVSASVGRARRLTGWAAIALAVVACGAMVVASPAPAIDVWHILQHAGRTTARLGNVYEACWPTNTDPRTDCTYPYLPLTTVVQLPFRAVLGEIRWSYVAALAATAVLVARIAPRPVGLALGALVVVQPKVLFLVEQAWTEPLLLAGVALMVWAARQDRGGLAIAGLVLVLATKQHAILLLPLAAWWPRFGVRRAAVAAVVAAATTLPWIAAGPRAFLDDVAGYHLDAAPRPDALTLYAAALDAGTTLPFALVVAVTGLVLAAVLLLLPRTTAGFCVGSVAVIHAFDLVNKQSFFNQWSLVLGLLVIAAAVSWDGDDESDEPSARPLVGAGGRSVAGWPSTRTPTAETEPGRST